MECPWDNLAVVFIEYLKIQGVPMCLVPKNTKCIGEKVALLLETCIEANKLDG